MEIGIWLIIGCAIGAAANWLMPGPRAGGPIVSIAVGVVAAVSGGLIGHFLSEPSVEDGFRPISRVSAAAVALMAILALRSWAMRHELSRRPPPE